MADDTRRFGKVRRTSTVADPLQELRTAIAEIRGAPRDPEPRRYLRALAAEQGTWDQLAGLLADEARGAEDPEVAAALYEQLADVHEDLDQPLEMLTAMEAVVRLEPDDVDQLDRLAWLYHRVGAWARAGETFERVAKLAFDVQARSALRAAGQLYRDNGWLDRAAVVYRELVARKPGDRAAWQALDEVLTQLARWGEVAEVRGELASRALGPIDKAALLRAQARAFEQAGDAARAAELLARAVGHAPEDVSGLVDYAQVLARDGKGREAAELLATRVTEAIARGAETEDIAALRLRLVGVLDDVCCDRIAARAVLDELLAAAPEHLPALERLVQYAKTDPDRRAHPEALLRHAAALYETDKATLLIEAAREFRELHDHAATTSALERALELVDDAELRVELDDARAALEVERAAEEAEHGDRPGAEHRLRAILATRPHHVEANHALVELLATGGRLDAASEHLQRTLAGSPAELAGDRLASLVHSYARVRAQLGDADEAHQLLHEAHHHDRKNLAITLALGESCFARRLWREAALHLGSLANHPEASRHATDVAAGLVHAAQAEVRALRPANASKHYDAAVRIDPRCARAWHALAEAALERHDLPRAAECLEREAAATTDPRERARLYDALGDLMRDALHDPVRAERCWVEVAESAEAPLLEKLLALQRTRAPDAARGMTCERLAAVVPDPVTRKHLLDEAAAAFQEVGELVRARAVASRLVGEHPLDEAAVTRASAIAIALGNAGAAAGWLRRALGAWDAAGDRGAGQPDRAELWRRLGEVESIRGNAQAALVAFERAVATAPDSSGARGARRALVDLAGISGRPAGELLVALVEADPQPADVLALARELAPENLDDARARFELAIALGATLELADENLLSSHVVRPMASDEAYGAPLDEAARLAIDDPDDAPIAGILDLVAEVASMILPDARAALARSEFAGATKLAASSNAASVAMYPQIAKALGGPPTLLYTNARVAELSIVLAQPPVVVIGPRLAAMRARSHADAEQTSDAELRFLLGRVVELTRPRRVFTADAESFSRFIGALAHAFGRPDPAVAPEIAAEAERLHKIIPMLVRRRIADRLAAIETPLDPAAYVAASQRAADRAGLLACGRIDLAVSLAGGPGRARHLIALAASRGYLAIRRNLRPRRSRQ